MDKEWKYCRECDCRLSISSFFRRAGAQAYVYTPVCIQCTRMFAKTARNKQEIEDMEYIDTSILDTDELKRVKRAEIFLKNKFLDPQAHRDIERLVHVYQVDDIAKMLRFKRGDEKY